MKYPRSIIALVLVMCALLYIAGVLSGLYANRITEERTRDSLSVLQRETREDIEAYQTGTAGQISTLNSYITFLEANINTVQVQQDFLATVPNADQCTFSEISMRHLTDQLQLYRNRLPYRLEEYERETQLTEEYHILKQQYNALSIRTWVFARKMAAECDSDLVHGLYFYTAACMTCARQGEELDAFTRSLQEEGHDVMLFTIDAEADDPMVTFLQTYYNITKVPAVIVNDRVFQGPFTDVEELREAAR